jgi:hypothetical protein
MMLLNKIASVSDVVTTNKSGGPLTRMRTSLIVWTAIASSALVGCGADADSTKVESVREAMFPDADSSTKDGNKQVRDDLARCMKTEGFDFEQTTIGLAGDPDAKRPVGTYGVTVKTKMKIPDRLPEGFGTPDYDKALNGTTEPGAEPTADSCLGKAISQNKGPVQLEPKKVQRLSKKYEQLFRSDKRVQKLITGWSPCMRNAGFNYSDFSSIEEDLERRVPNATTEELLKELQAEERKIWTTDQKCQEPFIEDLKKIALEFERQAAAEYVND